MSEPIAAAEGIDETTAVSSDAVTLSLDGAPAAAPSEGGKRRFTGRKRPERQSTNEDPRTPAERRIVFVANLLLNLCGVVLWAGMLTVNALYDGIISTTGWELSHDTVGSSGTTFHLPTCDAEPSVPHTTALIGNHIPPSHPLPYRASEPA